MSDLKPCPFCGGKAAVDHVDGNIWVAYCSDCLIQTGGNSSKGRAVKRWNTRPAPELPEGFALDGEGDLIDDAGDLLAYRVGVDKVGIVDIDHGGDVAELSADQVRALVVWLVGRSK